MTNEMTLRVLAENTGYTKYGKDDSFRCIKMWHLHSQELWISSITELLTSKKTKIKFSGCKELIKLTRVMFLWSVSTMKEMERAENTPTLEVCKRFYNRNILIL